MFVFIWKQSGKFLFRTGIESSYLHRWVIKALSHAIVFVFTNIILSRLKPFHVSISQSVKGVKIEILRGHSICHAKRNISTELCLY